MVKKKVQYFSYACVGMRIKDYKTFLHLSNQRTEKDAKAEFFELYKMGDYGCLQVVKLPQPERRTI